jgi:RNA polymerase sigma-70 factor (ECF subfamily)
MNKINLRDYYPFYDQPHVVEAPSCIVAFLKQSKKDEAAHTLRVYRNRAYYSLNRGDGIESDLLYPAFSAEDIVIEKALYARLYSAIAELPPKQSRRIIAYYFLNMTKAEIAKQESVARSTVGESLEKGIANLEKILKNWRD